MSATLETVQRRLSRAYDHCQTLMEVRGWLDTVDLPEDATLADLWAYYETEHEHNAARIAQLRAERGALERGVTLPAAALDPVCTEVDDA